jgi:heme/copper-type cytochrome/quinol oxidase subunit 2
MPRWIYLVTVIISIIGIGYGCSGSGLSKAILLDVSIENRVMNPEDIVITHQDKVTINITSDKSGSIHIHGYNIEQVFEKGKQAKLEFQAYATGKFNIAFHGSGQQNDNLGGHSHDGGIHEEFIIGSLTVNPD